MVFTIIVGGFIHPDPIFPANAAHVAGLGALFGGEVGAIISVKLCVRFISEKGGGNTNSKKEAGSTDVSAF